jgi:hypothetical protein
MVEGASKNPHFIPAAVLRQMGSQINRVADVRKNVLLAYQMQALRKNEAAAFYPVIASH